MGFAGISPWSLLLILAIILLLFGSKRLTNIGRDLGKAMKSFRSGLEEPGDENLEKPLEDKSETDKL